MDFHHGHTYTAFPSIPLYVLYEEKILQNTLRQLKIQMQDRKDRLCITRSSFLMQASLRAYWDVGL